MTVLCIHAKFSKYNIRSLSRLNNNFYKVSHTFNEGSGSLNGFPLRFLTLPWTLILDLGFVNIYLFNFLIEILNDKTHKSETFVLITAQKINESGWRSRNSHFLLGFLHTCTRAPPIIRQLMKLYEMNSIADYYLVEVILLN